MNSRFGHLQYYVGPRCHGKLKKEKEEVKRKLKLLRGLSGELSAASQSGSVFHFGDVLVGEFQGKHISVEETREALGRRLQQLKSEEKEQKRKRKLEKTKMRAARVQTNHNSSSSSSSESSDNEGNVINTSYQIRKALSLSQPFPDQWATNAIQGSTLPSPLRTQQHGSQRATNAIQGSTLPSPPQTRLPGSNVENGRRVEVCMGNKCRKGGAGELMEEFEKVMGVEGAVCGCKCMGKCRDGPNVRVCGSLDTVNQSPLCIGVGLEDVDRIVADILGQPHKHSTFAPATATS
ncbi:diacylglycerol O-acyltransferase 3, cytosolic [Momordica charantia]|uniref:Diacylglycerol O-acyltransferase 3, cytosolic n=1 Tax=Momordica charantia TaxID=3673 RepID=A0A6J1CA81_MOMCH|nr:diacylglycerol O-acyltransferase 3, cytosolic [Momordica charantia]